MLTHAREVPFHLFVSIVTFSYINCVLTTWVFPRLPFSGSSPSPIIPKRSSPLWEVKLLAQFAIVPTMNRIQVTYFFKQKKTKNRNFG